jgi:hypothetical protein
MSIQVWVFDDLGTAVPNASVSVSLGGVNYAAYQNNQSYFVDIHNVNLSAGIHQIDVDVSHVYGIGIGVGQAEFSVNIRTNTLKVISNFQSVVQQYDNVTAVFNITDAFGQPIIGANVYLRSGEIIFDLQENMTTPGVYHFNSTMNIGIGNHTFDLHVERFRIVGSYALQINLEVFGNLDPNVFYIPRVEGGKSFEIAVFIKDKFGPVSIGTLVTIEINGTRYTQTRTIGEPEYIFIVLADFLMGENTFNVFVNASYASSWSDVFSIRAYSDSSAYSSLSTQGGTTIEQGTSTTMELDLQDWLGRPVSGASVTLYVKALSYPMQEIAPGLYSTNVSTSGWAPGEYNYTVSVVHDDIETGEEIGGSLIVTGLLSIDVTYFPEDGTQDDPLEILIAVQDMYGNPIPDLEIRVSMMDLQPILALETDVVGTYLAFIPIVPSNQEYGLFEVIISIDGEYVQSSEVVSSVRILAAVPDFTMTPETITIGAGASFLLSLIGMFIYFRISSSTRIADESIEGLTHSIRNMDRIYLLMSIACGAGLIVSYLYYLLLEFGLALVYTITLLGGSVLLYGLWLYRDAVSAVMIDGKLSRQRILLGLWHIVFVPVVLVIIMFYGSEIDWFKSNIIDQTFSIGEFYVPAIMTTIFTAYISSIIVVVVNLYREIGKGIKKIAKMEDADTHPDIVEDEKISMVNRFSSSIRIKFLMFLVVVGATTVMSMEFLQSFQLAIIVLMPIFFLVIIPFIASKVLQILSKLSGLVRGKRVTTVS